MKRNRTLLSVIMLTTLLASQSPALAARAKGSTPATAQTEAAVPQTEAAAPQTEAVVPQTEAAVPQTEAVVPQTEASAPQPEEEGAKMEGEGFLTPREALAAYIAGMQHGDIDEMISAFAVESVAANYDIAKMIDRVRAYTPVMGYVPNANDLSVRINIENRRKSITDIIRSHYLILTESPLSESESYGQSIALTDEHESAQALVDELFIPSNADLPGSIRFENEFLSPALLSDMYMNSHNLTNLRRQAEQVNAQGITSVAARFYCNDRPYLIAMDAIQYGTKWYLYQGNGILAAMLNMEYYRQGLMPLDADAADIGTDVDLISGIVNDLDLSVRTDASGDSFLLNLDAAISGQEALRALLEITPEKLAFSLPDIENVRYEYDLQKLLPVLMQAYDSYQFRTPEELAGPLSGIEADITMDEVTQALWPYVEYLGGELQSATTTQTGVIELEQLGKTADGTIMTCEPGAGELAAIFNGLADRIENDEQLKALVDKVCASVINPQGLGGVLLNSSASYGADMDLEEIASQLQAGYSELPSILREAAQEVSQQGLGGAYVRLIIGQGQYSPCKYLLQAGSAEMGDVFKAGLELDPDGTGLGAFMETQDQDLAFTFDALDSEGFSTTMMATVKVNKVPVLILTFVTDPENGFSEEFPLRSVSADIMGIGLSVTADTSHAAEKPAGEVVDLTDYEPEDILEVLQSLGEKIVSGLPEVTYSTGIEETVPEEETSAAAKGGTVSIEFVLGYGTEDAQTVLTEEDLAYAKSAVQSDPAGENEYCIEVGFNEEGKQAFADLTREHIGETLSILVNGEEISAPVIHSEITDGKAVIAGGFTEEEVENIVASLME